MAEEWQAGDFHRRRYTYNSDGLNGAHVEVIVKVNGKTVVHVQGREPGMIAFVSKPQEEGFDIDMCQPGARFTDVKPIDAKAEKVAPWQLMALDLAVPA